VTEWPRLWLCADLHEHGADDVLARVRAVVSVVRACVWLRSPLEFPAAELTRIALRLRAVMATPGSLLLVGDRADVAIAAGADGVHTGSRGLRPGSVRALLEQAGGPCQRVSSAAHDEAEAARYGTDCDALVVSPFRAVPGKGPALSAAGMQRVRRAAAGKFVVALGGVGSAVEAREALRCGANAVALRRAFLDAGDPVAACTAIALALDS